MDFKKMLQDAKLPEKTVEVCLRGDLKAEHERLDSELLAKLREKERTGATSLAGSGEAQLTEAIEALEAQMREHTYPFRLRAMGRPAYQRMKELPEHQMRKDPEHPEQTLLEDLRVGVNNETFMEPLLRASIVDPVMDDATWAEFVEKITEAQYQQLIGAAWDLNQGDVSIPFSRAALLARRSTEDG